MKKWFPMIVVGVFAAWLLAGLRPAPEKNDFNSAEFGRLPVLLNGRVQPLDSVGMNTLLSMRGKRTVGQSEGADANGQRAPKLNPTEWLMEVMMRPDEADKYKTFRVQHPDLQSMLGGTADGLEYFSFNEIAANKETLRKIEEQARPILQNEREKKSDPQLRTPFQKDLIHLFESLYLYNRLKNSMMPEGTHDFAALLADFQRITASASAAIEKNGANAEDLKRDGANQGDLQKLSGMLKHFEWLAEVAYPLMVPPLDSSKSRDDWVSVGASLTRSPQVHPAVSYYAAMGTALNHKSPADFNRTIAEYKQWLEGRGLTTEISKGRREFSFNHYEPFYKTTVIYVAALICGCLFWVNLSETIRKAGFYLLGLGLLLHTVGLVTRMALEGRPPVTNLYSSAIFVGWGIVILGMIFERVFRVGVGIVMAGTGGFVTQIIAHHLSLSGDTMEMLRAVLDTNIWLATHVVVITLGYSAMFAAGLVAVAFVLLGFFTPLLTGDIRKALARIVYGIICFATLFSFVGTVLGGIWADQSWGRFWGWDPKENGALLIVIWCAVILHARWGGLVKDRGLMALALFGNIVTAFSWFGVNMLGVGLHAYGFMDKAFTWLMIFNVSQVALIALALVPEERWRSFRFGGKAAVGGGLATAGLKPGRA
ncbi:MAG: cytochrome C biogenesis protein [Pedosphaera sp.]|nr:cytochrome C biogenesis protein [Pedosphaera sp.]